MSGSARESRRLITRATAPLWVAAITAGSLGLASGPAVADSDKAPPGQSRSSSANAGGGKADHERSSAASGAGSSSKRSEPSKPEPAPEPEPPARPEPTAKPEKAAAPERASKPAKEDRPEGGPGGSRPSGSTPDGKDHGDNGKDHGDKSADHPGNNGTVKIDAEEFDTHPNNQPHVGCQFQVDFYNYGTGDFDASVNFAQHAPTPGDVSTTQGSPEVSIGEDRPGGGTDLDGEETYELAFTDDPHPKQGYHVKLTINAPYSQGADTKHKVFWVEPCDAPDEEIPGQEIPGEENPGEENPGEENPGEENPGEEIPGEENPGEENPIAEVPGVIPPDGSGELPGTSTTPPASSSQSSSSTSSSTSDGPSSTSAGTSADSAGESAAPVPTAVDAGLGATDRSTTEPALATGLLGLGGLVAAGVAMATRRRRATD